jgi:hypothetical protein
VDDLRLTGCSGGVVIRDVTSRSGIMQTIAVVGLVLSV